MEPKEIEDKIHDFKLLEKFLTAIKNSNDEIESQLRSPVFKELSHDITHEARRQCKLLLSSLKQKCLQTDFLRTCSMYSLIERLK